jgi:hypothetical protein
LREFLDDMPEVNELSNWWPGIVEVAGNGGVGAVGGLGDAAELLLQKIGGDDAFREGDCLVAEFGISVEEDGFVDEVLTEECAVEVRAALEEEAEDFALGESGEHRWKTETAAVVGNVIDLDADGSQRGGLGGRGRGSAEDEEIGFRAAGACGGADKLRVEWDTEVGIENDAEEWAAAGQSVGTEESAAVGELGIVGKDGADAGEDGVGGVAEELDLVAGVAAGEPVRLVWVT